MGAHLRLVILLAAPPGLLDLGFIQLLHEKELLECMICRVGIKVLLHARQAACSMT